MSSTTLTLVTDADLDKTLAESKLAVESIQSLKAAFQPHFSAFTKLATAAQAIPASAPKAAAAMRKELKQVRLAAEKTRKELKEDSLLKGRAVDGVNNLLLYALSPIEKHLESIEKAEEIAAAKALNDLRSARLIELTKYTEAPTYDIGVLPQAQFDAILGAAKKAHEDKVEAERQAAVERSRKEAEAEAERQRLKAENEKLAKLAADAEKARIASEAKARQEKAERDAADKARQAKEDAEKKRLVDEAAAKQKAIEEAARKDREIVEKKAADERAKREAAEAEIARQKKVEEGRKAAELARIEREKALAQAAQEKAEAAPDKVKLTTLATTIRELTLPTLTSKKGKAFAPKLVEQIAKMAAWLEDSAKTL